MSKEPMKAIEVETVIVEDNDSITRSLVFDSDGNRIGENITYKSDDAVTSNDD